MLGKLLPLPLVSPGRRRRHRYRCCICGRLHLNLCGDRATGEATGIEQSASPAVKASMAEITAWASADACF